MERSEWRAGLSLVFGLILSACATGEWNYESALTDVPAEWSRTETGATPIAAIQAPADVDWWNRFDDPVLQDLVVQGMQANTSILTSKAALRQARALRDEAAAALWPSLDGSVSAQNTALGLDKGERSESNRFQAGLDANWALDVFGVNRKGVDAAAAAAWASAADIGDVQVQVAAEIGVNYIQLRSAQSRLAIARANLLTQKDTLQIAQWRMQAGLGAAIETEQARASAEQTSAGLPLLQTSIDQSAHALGVLVGRPPMALAANLAPPAPTPEVTSELPLSLPAEILRQRADVRASEYRVMAALADLDQANRARLPSFSIGGSIGLSSLTLGALTNGASVARSLLADVTLPIFDGGARRARSRGRAAALDQAQLAYRATILRSLQEVEDALVALRDDKLRLVSLRNAAQAAGVAALLARQQYASGLVDFQVVLETQRTQLSTEDGVAASLANVSTDNIALYKSLGGGWPGLRSNPL